LSDELNRTKFNFKTLRTIYVSGSILNDLVYEKAHTVFDGIPIYNVYGLSEAGPRVTAQRKDCCKSNSVGTPIKDIKIVLVDEHGNTVDKGECGILHVNTPSRLNGYTYGETKHKSLYKNWLNTGDIGYWDLNDELRIVGRIDDVIILDSHKVYPSDLENRICQIEGIKECVVAKVEYENVEFLACLYTGEGVVESTVRNALKDKLLPYEIPRRFILVQSIPRTLNGKISKIEAKEYVIKEIGKERRYDKG